MSDLQEPTRQDVIETLRDEDGLKYRTIAKRMYDYDITCPECGKRKDDYKQFVHEVKGIVREMNRDSEIIYGPGFVCDLAGELKND